MTMHSTELERLSEDLCKYRSHGIKNIEEYLNLIASFLLTKGSKERPPTNITFDVRTKNISYHTSEGQDKSIQSMHKIVDNSNIDFVKLSQSKTDIAVLSGIDSLHQGSTYFEYLANSYQFLTHTLVQYTFKHATESHHINLGLHYYVSTFINSSPIMANLFQNKLVKEIELHMSTAYSVGSIRLDCLKMPITELKLSPVESRAFSLLVHLHLSKQPQTYQFVLTPDNQFIQFIPVNESVTALVKKVARFPGTYKNAHQYVVLSEQYTSGKEKPENADAKLINLEEMMNKVTHLFNKFQGMLLHFKTAHSRVPNANDIQCMLIRFLYRVNMNKYIKHNYQLEDEKHLWFTTTDTEGADRPLKQIEVIYSQFSDQLVGDIANIAWHGTNPCHTETFLTNQLASSTPGKKLRILIETFQGDMLIQMLSELLNKIFNRFNAFIQQDIMIRIGLLLVISHDKVTGTEQNSSKLLDEALQNVLMPLKKNRAKYQEMLGKDGFFQHRVISSISKLVGSISNNKSLSLIEHGKKIWDFIIFSQIGTRSDFLLSFLHHPTLREDDYVRAINKANSKMKIYGDNEDELHIKPGHAVLDYAESITNSIRPPNRIIVVAPGALAE